MLLNRDNIYRDIPFLHRAISFHPLDPFSKRELEEIKIEDHQKIDPVKDFIPFKFGNKSYVILFMDFETTSLFMAELLKFVLKSSRLLSHFCN